MEKKGYCDSWNLNVQHQTDVEGQISPLQLQAVAAKQQSLVLLESQLCVL